MRQRVVLAGVVVAVVLVAVFGGVGHGVGGPPTAARLLLDWRFDLFFGTAAVVLASAYLAGVRRVPGWSRARTTAWLAGCGLVLVATSSGIGRYAPTVLGAQVASHILLAVLAPVLLVLGGPVTLAVRALPARARVVAAVRSPLCRVLTRPGVAFLLLVGPCYLLYLGGGLDWALGEYWQRLVANAVLLVGGYAFFWPVFGVDPGVRRPSHPARVGLMFALLPALGFLAVVLTNEHGAAGNVVWALGELPVLVLLVVSVVLWARSDEREAARDEPDLAAYNEMLARLGGRSEQVRRRDGAS